jgi:hypothetical protein
LLTDSHRWRVEARRGDGDSSKWHRDFQSETDAQNLITAMIDRTGGPAVWRSLHKSEMPDQTNRMSDPSDPSGNLNK